RELRPRRPKADALRVVFRVVTDTVGVDRRAAARARQVNRAGIGGADAEPPVRRESVAELRKSRLVVRQIGVDVRVIEFDAGEKRGARAIVQELGTLVEVGGVVLISL